MNAFTSQINKAAWVIRKAAAKDLGVSIKEISWKVCLEMARKGEQYVKHSENKVHAAAHKKFDSLLKNNSLSKEDMVELKKAEKIRKKKHEWTAFCELSLKPAMIQFISTMKSERHILEAYKWIGIETRSKEEIEESKDRRAFIESDYTPKWLQKEIDKMHAHKGLFQLSPSHALD